jgi:hypothetical protein
VLFRQSAESRKKNVEDCNYFYLILSQLSYGERSTFNLLLSWSSSCLCVLVPTLFLRRFFFVRQIPQAVVTSTLRPVVRPRLEACLIQEPNPAFTCQGDLHSGLGEHVFDYRLDLRFPVFLNILSSEPCRCLDRVRPCRCADLTASIEAKPA